MAPRLRVGTAATCTVLSIALTSACDSYEAPCDTTPTTTVLSESAPPSTVSMLTRFEASGDLVVASWLTLTRSTEDGSYRPWLAQVAVLTNDGDLVSRQSFPLFADLEDDEVPEDNLGFCWSPSGLVVHWTQATTVSEVGEPPSIRQSLRLQRFSPDAVPEPPFAAFNMDCVDCVLRLSSACHQDRATILFAAWPEDGNDSIPVRALSWDLVADQTSSGPIDWFASASPQSPAPALRVEDDVLLLVTADRAWAVDSEVQLRGGPIPLPVPINRQMHWSDDTFEGTVIWSTASAASSDGPPTDDVFIRRHDGFGQPLAPMERLGASERVAALARTQDEIGVLLRDRGQDAFAWADADGMRLGGDVRLGPELRTSGMTSGMGEVLLARGSGRFIHLVGEPGRIQRREISCAR